MKKPVYYKKNRKLIVEEDKDLISAISPYTGMIYELNLTGSFVWKILTRPRTEKEILKIMLNKYEVSEKTLAKDINSFLKQSTKNKLLIKS